MFTVLWYFWCTCEDVLYIYINELSGCKMRARWQQPTTRRKKIKPTFVNDPQRVNVRVITHTNDKNDCES